MGKSSTSFRPGQSGNPRGKPKGRRDNRTLEVEAWARSVLESPKVRQTFLFQAEAGRMPPAIVQELFNRAYGKVKDCTELAGDVGAALVRVAATIVLLPPTGGLRPAVCWDWG